MDKESRTTLPTASPDATGNAAGGIRAAPPRRALLSAEQGPRGQASPAGASPPAPLARSRRVTTLVLAVVAFATVLRVWGIDSGLPDTYVHDEIFEAKRALALLRGEFDIHRVGKGFLYYVLAAVYGVQGLALTLAGRYGSLAEFVSDSIVHPGPAIFLGRLVSALLGGLSVLAAYRLGRKVLRDDVFALVLSFAWGSCWLAIWLAHWLFVETCLVTATLLTLLALVDVHERGRLRDYVLSGVGIAVAAATKIYGGSLVLILLAFHFLPFSREAGTSRRHLLDRRLWIALATFAGCLALLDPGLPRGVLVRLGFLAGVPEYAAFTDVPATTHLRFYVDAVRWSLGNPLFLLAGGGLALALVRRAGVVSVLGTFSVLLVFAIGLRRESHLVYQRYVLMFLPGFFLCAVYGAHVLHRQLVEWWRHPLARVVLPGVVVLLAGANGLPTTFTSSVFRDQGPPVQQVAKEWIEENVPEGARIALKGENGWPGLQTVPILDLAESYRAFHERVVRSGAYLKDSNILPDLARARDVKRYDLVTVRRFEDWSPLADYLARGVEFFVIDPAFFGPDYPEVRSLRAKQTRVRLYEEIRRSDEVELLQRFEGTTLQGIPARIEIYRVRDPRAGTVRERYSGPRPGDPADDARDA